MRYIVEMDATTKVAMLVEADSEDHAADIAERLVREGREELLYEYLDPNEHLQVDPVVNEVLDAAEVGWADKLPANAMDLP